MWPALTPKALNIGAVLLAGLTLTGLVAVSFSPLWAPVAAPSQGPVAPYTASALSSLYRPTPPPSDCIGWAHFTSDADLRAHVGPLYTYGPYEGDTRTFETSAAPGAPMAGASTTAAPPGGVASADYTGTTVQVAGIDEPDMVKTDGTYLYTVSQGTVTILRAYPPQDLAVVSTISLDGQWPTGLFVNGNRLVVLTSAYGGIVSTGLWGAAFFAPVVYSPTTSVLVFDIADPAHPALASNLTLSGYTVGARMIGNEVFVVLSYYLFLNGEKLELPVLKVDGAARPVVATDIGYFPEAKNSTSLTQVLIVNLTKPDAASLTTLLADAGSTLYVSYDSLYLVGYGRFFAQAEGAWVDASTVHRLFLWQGSVSCAVTGEVRGHVLNSYSLDEWGGNLRVATTEWASAGGQTANHLFVLDRSLKLIGSVEAIAPGETIQSVRFLGDRAYVVTFRQVDPFFVIDLSDATAPRVLGELKVTGFSRFLFPVGDKLILGLGPETTAPDAEGRVQTVGFKLSLFDVSDVSSPREVSKYVIPGTWVSSTAEYDPHALLWVADRHLLAIPVQVYNYSADKVSSAGSYWQGVYVFDITAAAGVQLEGRITHDEASDPTWTNWANMIRRTLQVGDFLYTVSDTTVQINDINTLDLVARVEFWTPPTYPGPVPLDGTGGGSGPTTR